VLSASPVPQATLFYHETCIIFLVIIKTNVVKTRFTHLILTYFSVPDEKIK
jgi:hypothetical protein